MVAVAAGLPTSPRGSFDDPLLSTLGDDDTSPISHVPPKKKKPWVLLCALVFLLIACVDVGAYLAEAPKTRVYEANLCLRYYEKHDTSKIGPDGNVEEELCKIDPVQQKMASIFGWQETFDAIPSILLALPYGALADKVGRKWVFVASLVGLQLNSTWILIICYFRSLPLQLTWFSSAFYIIGGGPIVAAAVGITMLSDICPPEKRTSIFLYVSASVLVAELIAPLLAAKLMENGDWLPLVLALVIQGGAIAIGLLFPETLHLRDLAEPKDMNSDSEEEIELQAVHKGSDFTLKAQLRHFKDAVIFLRQDVQIALVVFTFLASRMGRQAISLLIRYASKRYNWKIKDAAYLLSFRAATNLVAMTVFIPLVNLFLLKWVKLPAHVADIWLARGSIIITTLSFFIMAAAAHPALLIIGLLVFNLGSGFSAAMRSTSIHVIGGQSSPDVGRLFAVIAIMEAFGAMIAGPLLAKIFEWGIEVGEPWIGIPYAFGGFVFCIITVVTFFIVVEKKTKFVYTAVEEEEELEGPLSPVSPIRRHVD